MFLQIINLILLFFSFLAPQSSDLNDNLPSNAKLFTIAKKQFINGEYEKSRENLLMLVRSDPGNASYNYELGRNYYYTHLSKELALPFFEATLKYTDRDTAGDIFYLLGDLYQYTGKLDKAIVAYENMKRFTKATESGYDLSSELNFRIAQCKQGKAFAINVEDKIKIENLGSNVNSRYFDHTPFFLPEEDVLIFTSRRRDISDGIVEYEMDKMNEHIYISKVEEGSNYQKAEKLMSEFFGISADFTDNNAFVGYSFDKNEVLTLKNGEVFYSYRTPTGDWIGPSLMPEPINLKGSYQTHAVLSADGTTIYFSSLRPGGYGGFDIYKSIMRPDNSWGDAINLGAEINTKYDENSPYITEDGTTLYFASKGHNTIGGFDIFYSKAVTENKWEKAKNIGRPINSTADDSYFFPYNNFKNALYVSARPEGMGGADIYKITYLNEPEFINCNFLTISKAKHLKAPNSLFFLATDTIMYGQSFTLDASLSKIEDADIRDYYWNMGDSTEILKGISVKHTYKKPGNYEIMLEASAMHNTYLTTTNYCIKKKIVVLSEGEILPVMAAKFVNAPVENSMGKTLEPATTLNIDLVEDEATINYELQKVYYDLDKSFFTYESRLVLEKAVRVLHQFPYLNVAVFGHTDSRGGKTYNRLLSERRAQTVVDFLIEFGISPSRITSYGKGDEDLLNECVEGVWCPEEKHKINRRAELQLIKQTEP